ncbi:hypothetical protein GCM10010191_42070 [Actinomadura vinacea]|uniref:Lipoprotein n=1 Tax=Actinomadura vinacea TaxID=115336 RepID=A0ABN3JAB4_9ACTN
MRPRTGRSIRAVAAACATVLAFGAAGCGVRPTGVVRAGPAPRAAADPSNNVIYLIRNGKLSPVARPGVPGLPEFVLNQLVQGPTEAERRAGLRSEIPGNVRLTYFRPVSDRRQPDVMVHGPAEHWSGKRLRWSRPAQAQLACTVGTIPDVRGIWISPEGAALSQYRAYPDMPMELRCDQFRDVRP